MAETRQEIARQLATECDLTIQHAHKHWNTAVQAAREGDHSQVVHDMNICLLIMRCVALKSVKADCRSK